MDKHSLTPLFDPARIWVLYTPGCPDLALAQTQLAPWVSDGRAHFDEVTPALLVADAPAHRADVVWLLMDANAARHVLPALGRWHLQLVLLSGDARDIGEADRLLQTARSHGVRLLGPGAMGLQRPLHRLNLSLLGALPPAGGVAFVAQSGSLAASTVDWALDQGVGFSAVVTLGAQRDIDLAEVLDFLAADAATESIVLYLEGVREPRSFLSALRAAATIKPVVVLKAGRHPA